MPLIAVSPVFKTTAHFKSLQGFTVIAGTVFVVVSYCSGEDEGWLPEASNKIFNEFLLRGKV